MCSDTVEKCGLLGKMAVFGVKMGRTLRLNRKNQKSSSGITPFDFENLTLNYAIFYFLSAISGWPTYLWRDHQMSF